MMEHSDIIKYEKRKNCSIIGLDEEKKRGAFFFVHCDGAVSAGDDDVDDDASPLAKFFKHLAANVE